MHIHSNLSEIKLPDVAVVVLSGFSLHQELLFCPYKTRRIAICPLMSLPIIVHKFTSQFLNIQEKVADAGLAKTRITKPCNGPPRSKEIYIFGLLVLVEACLNQRPSQYHITHSFSSHPSKLWKRVLNGHWLLQMQTSAGRLTRVTYKCLIISNEQWCWVLVLLSIEPRQKPKDRCILK